MEAKSWLQMVELWRTYFEKAVHSIPAVQTREPAAANQMWVFSVTSLKKYIPITQPSTLFQVFNKILCLESLRENTQFE